MPLCRFLSLCSNAHQSISPDKISTLYGIICLIIVCNVNPNQGMGFISSKKSVLLMLHMTSFLWSYIISTSFSCLYIYSTYYMSQSVIWRNISHFIQEPEASENKA